MIGRPSIALVLLLLACTSPANADARSDLIVSGIAAKARDTLARIPDEGRKLLALRSYLRSTRSLEARWSWTQAEIDAYLKSDQYVTAMAAVAAVAKAFEIKNPGHSLRVNTEIRSLDEQVGKWNSNASVQKAGAELEAALVKWTADNPKAEKDGLRAFLTGWQPAVTVMLAAPGLTAHGRGEAFDFQIVKDGSVLAGADSGGISRQWQDGGWSTRLKEAVRLSTMPFDGPLQDPNEPWHYDYNPPVRSELVAAAEREPPQPAAKPPQPEAQPSNQSEQSSTNEKDLLDPSVVPAPLPAPRIAQNAETAKSKPVETRRSVKQKVEKSTRRSASSKQAKGSKATQSGKSKSSRSSKAKKPAWIPPFLR